MPRPNYNVPKPKPELIDITDEEYTTDYDTDIELLEASRFMEDGEETILQLEGVIEPKDEKPVKLKYWDLVKKIKFENPELTHKEAMKKASAIYKLN